MKEHKDEILLFNVADIYMKKNEIDTSYLEIKKRVKELENVKKNVEQILDRKIEVTSKKDKNVKKDNSREINN